MRKLDREHIRPVLESEIERLINALDLLDGDTDLEDGADREVVCEDEGADESDTGNSEDDAPSHHYLEADERAATTKAIVTVHEKLRTVMKAKGRKPLKRLTVHGDMIWK